jgi:hypothetical protein
MKLLSLMTIIIFGAQSISAKTDQNNITLEQKDIIFGDFISRMEEIAEQNNYDNRMYDHGY